MVCLDRIRKKHKRYIVKYYPYQTAGQISKKIGLPEHQIRDIAMQLGVTKRLFSDDVYPSNEYWTDIYHPTLSFSKYEISEYGHFRRRKDHMVIQWIYSSDGYCTVKLINDDGKRMSLNVHRLVAFRFCPVRVVGQVEVNHIDGKKDNNHHSNLEWVTPSENQKHSYKLGLRIPANLKHDLNYQIPLVCQLIADGLTNFEIIDYVDFDISRENIQNIRAKRTHTKISNFYF